MYYMWAGTNETNFVTCSIKEFDGWMNFSWISGKALKPVKIPEILIYYCNKNSNPGDYPLTNTSQFLVSKRIVEVFKQMNVQNLDYYQSKIIQPNGIIIDDIWMEWVSCV